MSKVGVSKSSPHLNNITISGDVHGWLKPPLMRYYNLDNEISNIKCSLIDILLKIKTTFDETLLKNLDILIEYCKNIANPDANKERLIEYPAINIIFILLFTKSTEKSSLFISTKDNIITYFNTVLPYYLKIEVKNVFDIAFTLEYYMDRDKYHVNQILEKYYDRILPAEMFNIEYFEESEENNQMYTKSISSRLSSPPEGGSRRRLSTHKKSKKHIRKNQKNRK